jgi:hypothetical protein
VYEVTTDGQSRPQIEALDGHAGAAFAEARVLLEIAPWGSEPLFAAKPDGGLRTIVFGATGQGMITFLILEDQRRVDILDVLWIG